MLSFDTDSFFSLFGHSRKSYSHCKQQCSCVCVNLRLRKQKKNMPRVIHDWQLTWLYGCLVTKWQRDHIDVSVYRYWIVDMMLLTNYFAVSSAQNPKDLLPLGCYSSASMLLWFKATRGRVAVLCLRAFNEGPQSERLQGHLAVLKLERMSKIFLLPSAVGWQMCCCRLGAVQQQTFAGAALLYWRSAGD